MYQLKPPKVFIDKRVYEDRRSVERLNRMMPSIECDSVRDFSHDELEQIYNEEGWEAMRHGQKRQGEHEFQGDPVMVFGVFNWGFDPALDKAPAGSMTRAILGDERTFYNSQDSVRTRIEHGLVCQSVHDFHTMTGCVHRCDYCRRGGISVVMLNLEEWIERLHRFIEHDKCQRLFKYELWSDIHPLEPEYGASEMLVDYFAKQPGRYLMLFSKSANIDHLLDLDHRGKTVMCWTLSPHTVSRVVEKGTATMEERIEAAGKCAEAGYTVRFKFKPIVPLKGWRQECTQMIEHIFASLEPEHINMRLLSMMDAAEFKRIFDPAIFDPDCIRAMEESADQMRSSQDLSVGPFPHETRREIYRYILDEVARVSGKTSVSICAESERMWDDLGDRMGMTPADFVCNCGPQCVPGHPMYKSTAVRPA